MGGKPKGSDAKKCIAALEALGWTYEPSSSTTSHVVGILFCSERGAQRCRIFVYGTANNTGTALWKRARACTHGDAPKTAKW